MLGGASAGWRTAWEGEARQGDGGAAAGWVEQWHSGRSRRLSKLERPAMADSRAGARREARERPSEYGGEGEAEGVQRRVRGAQPPLLEKQGRAAERRMHDVHGEGVLVHGGHVPNTRHFVEQLATDGVASVGRDFGPPAGRFGPRALNKV